VDTTMRFSVWVWYQSTSPPGRDKRHPLLLGSRQRDALFPVSAHSNHTTDICYLPHHEGRDGGVVAYQRLVRRLVVNIGNWVIAMVSEAYLVACPLTKGRH